MIVINSIEPGDPHTRRILTYVCLSMPPRWRRRRRVRCTRAEGAHTELRTTITLARHLGVALRRRILANRLDHKRPTLFTMVFGVHQRLVIWHEADMVVTIPLSNEILDCSRQNSAVVLGWQTTWMVYEFPEAVITLGCFRSCLFVLS